MNLPRSPSSGSPSTKSVTNQTKALIAGLYAHVGLLSRERNNMKLTLAQNLSSYNV
eukprot:COSAG05_NODE_392_length_10391_cov_8.232899_13_plen_56_part_00